MAFHEVVAMARNVVQFQKGLSEPAFDVRQIEREDAIDGAIGFGPFEQGGHLRGLHKAEVAFPLAGYGLRKKVRFPPKKHILIQHRPGERFQNTCAVIAENLFHAFRRGL